MIQALFEKQTQFFQSNQTKTLEWRKQALLKLKNAIVSNQQHILEALEKDLHKHPVEGVMSEVSQILEEIKYALKLLPKYCKPQSVKNPISHFMGKSQIYYQPYGITLILGAWNYPFLITLAPLVGAIASGNCAILKPSELAPHSQDVLKNIIQECFEESFVSVVCGDEKVATELLALPVNYVFFTGSTRVGKIIAKSTAERLIPCTLELGGKNPCIVDESADLDLSAKRIVWGKFFNAGQTCVAPDYLLAHHSIKDQLIQALQKHIHLSFGEDPLQSNSFGKIITKTHYQRIKNLLDFDTSLGIIIGGKTSDSLQQLEPTLIDFGRLHQNPALSLTLMQEEIFGPILPIFSYENFQECLEFARKGEKPLATYLFSTNLTRQQKLIQNLPYGGGCINDCIMHITNLNLPFGGVGQSGMGCYHGKYSFETFSHKKAIYQAPKAEIPLRYPPYDTPFLGIAKEKILNFLFGK